LAESNATLDRDVRLDACSRRRRWWNRTALSVSVVGVVVVVAIVPPRISL
jgi:hypothetical protein